MLPDIIEILLPIVLILTTMAILIMLPMYFIRKKRNPDNPKNTIKRLVGMSFVASLIITLLLGSGLIAIYIKDVKEAVSSDDNVTIIGGADGPTSVFIAGKIGDDDMNKFSQITMDEAKEIFETPGDYIILDVRRADEYAGGHIPGAINVANESINDTCPEELPDMNQTIYVYCRSGNRSKQASEKLVSLGYTNIIEFGGILDWTGEIEK
ncbi:MAG: rhodanese-like domain-containing protein [Lachnospiraceae bacterium]|nr:rhodanese-like domain-containing protein [Lachnospiraceae bacterium]MDY4126147.1 rhodanese-like domain-containing protein [Lachnospiraceae bacterium]